MRKRLDEQKEAITNSIIFIGTACEDNLRAAMLAFEKQDRELAVSICHADDAVDERAHQIENSCLSLLLRQQPVASDLREVSAILKMVADLERIGDQASDIADIVLHLNFENNGEEARQITEMGKAALTMVHKSVESFVKRDAALAEETLRYDDNVDRYFVLVRNTLIDKLRQNPNANEISLDVLMIAKYLERIGDHACNVARWVIYAITGRDVKELWSAK